jgi:hypothetical protein
VHSIERQWIFQRNMPSPSLGLKGKTCNKTGIKQATTWSLKIETSSFEMLTRFQQITWWYISRQNSLFLQCLLIYFTTMLRLFMRWDSSVSTVTRLRAAWPRGWIFLFSVTSTLALESTQLHIRRVPRTVSPGVKWQGYQANNSPPNRNKFKNGGAISPFPHTSSWHGA